MKRKPNNKDECSEGSDRKNEQAKQPKVLHNSFDENDDSNVSRRRKEFDQRSIYNNIDFPH